MGEMTTFSNPIIPGFAPDPSVVMVDGTFFLVNSSFHLFPGLPIYASRDLQKWTKIGNAINRQEQIDLAGAGTLIRRLPTGFDHIATTGLLAPTIRHYNGTFYIVCTNLSNQVPVFCQNFYIHTNDIWSGHWSDPIPFEFQGIDTSLFIDDDGRAYIQGANYFDLSGAQPAATVKQFEIDLETGKPRSETKEIWPGFAKIDTEGPHMYKKDGYYYLLAAEGGTFEHHMLSIARSTDIWGPYESYEKNPIVTADGKDEHIQNTGHGELFQDQKGDWWAAVLAVRTDDHVRYPLGRETFLTPVLWPTGGWPMVSQPKMSFKHSGLPSTPPLKPVVYQHHDIARYVFLKSPDLNMYHFDETRPMISITPSQTDILSQAAQISFLGLRQPELLSTATVSLRTARSDLPHHVRAGLALYWDPVRAIRVYVDFASSAIVYNAVNVAAGLEDELRCPINPLPTSVSFQIRSLQQFYEFAYRTPEGQWKVMAQLDSKEMTFRDFTGPVFGIFASTDVDPTNVQSVDFFDFEIFENDKNSHL